VKTSSHPKPGALIPHRVVESARITPTGNADTARPDINQASPSAAESPAPLNGLAGEAGCGATNEHPPVERNQTMKEPQNKQIGISKSLQVVILVLGTGGIGKTFFARLLVEYLQIQVKKWDVPLNIYDADETVKADLARFFQTVDTCRLITREDIMELFNKVRSSTGITLVDVKADQQEQFRMSHTFAPTTISAFSRVGCKVVACIPVSNGKASSTATALDWVSILGPDCRYLLVENEICGPIREEGDDLKKFLEQVKPLRFKLPRLEEKIARELDERNVNVLSLLHAAGYESPNIPPSREQEPSFETDFGPYLSSPFNVPWLAAFWETFLQEAERTFPKLLDIAP
jgi:hypothetical protein